MHCFKAGTRLSIGASIFIMLLTTLNEISAADVESEQQTTDNPVATSANRFQPHGYFSAHDTHGNWSYEEIEDWNEMSPMCANGRRQSPINLDSYRSLKGKFPPITFTGYDTRAQWKIRNAGNNLQLTLNETTRAPSISGGGLPGTYIFHQLHFHWGSHCWQGSEHRRNSKAFAGEIHIVHHNAKYDDLEEALNHKDGIAVLAVWMKEEDFGGKRFFPMTSQLHKVRRPNSEVWLERTMAIDDMLPFNTDHFYRYFGSLTTPNCAEVVVWTIFHNPVTFSSHQMSEFRSLIDNRNLPMINNFRPLQPINGRKIFERGW